MLNLGHEAGASVAIWLQRKCWQWPDHKQSSGKRVRSMEIAGDLFTREAAASVLPLSDQALLIQPATAKRLLTLDL